MATILDVIILSPARARTPTPPRHVHFSSAIDDTAAQSGIHDPRGRSFMTDDRTQNMPDDRTHRSYDWTQMTDDRTQMSDNRTQNMPDDRTHTMLDAPPTHSGTIPTDITAFLAFMEQELVSLGQHQTTCTKGQLAATAASSAIPSIPSIPSIISPSPPLSSASLLDCSLEDLDNIERRLGRWLRARDNPTYFDFVSASLEDRRMFNAWFKATYHNDDSDSDDAYADNYSDQYDDHDAYARYYTHHAKYADDYPNAIYSNECEE